MQKTVYVNLPVSAVNWDYIDSRQYKNYLYSNKIKKMSNLKNIKAMNTVKEAALWTIYIIVMAAAIAGAMLVG